MVALRRYLGLAMVIRARMTRRERFTIVWAPFGDGFQVLLWRIELLDGDLQSLRLAMANRAARRQFATLASRGGDSKPEAKIRCTRD